MHSKHPLAFEDEITPIRKMKYSPALVYFMIFVGFPILHILFRVLHIINRIWRRHNA